MENPPRPLISVIVPVYKVEPWLERCVESIRNQDYDRLEIILVEDGSPDQCGAICDAFSRMDDRIRVIHRKNGGLSAARNSGLDICRGEYIGFVDSDDVIHPEMYSRLYVDILTHNTRLAFCQPLMCYDSSICFPPMKAESTCRSSHDLIRESLQDIKWFAAWTKLYHRSLFEGIRFPEGRTNEDYPTTLRVFSRCDQVVVNYNKLYAYCKREGSITTSPFSKHSFDQIISAKEVFLFIREKYPDCIGPAADILISSCLGLLLKTDGTPSKEMKTEREEAFLIIRQIFHQEKPVLSVHPVQRVLLSAASAGKFPYAIASWLYRALKKNNFQ